MHMKRALGTLTPYDTFKKATEIKLSAVDDLEDTITEGSNESQQDSANEAPSEEIVDSSTDPLST